MDKSLSTLIGIPWKVHGRDYSGVDCGGLVILASRVLYGLTVPDMWEYGAENNLQVAREAVNDLSLFSDPIEAAEDGAIAVIKFKNITHYGLVVGDRLLTVFESTSSHLRRLPPRADFYRIRGERKWA